MTWPKRYGGHERTFLERYVVLEEMLAAGAPVGAHWIADRQSGPLLLRFGTEAQRERFLPAHHARRARLRHRHERAGLRLRPGLDPHARRAHATAATSSTARRCGPPTRTGSDYVIALFRTAVVPDKKHEGLSQFLVDLKTPGITIRPIVDLAGEHHFNEVVFEDAFVPEDMRVGAEGDGWKQVTTELAFERSGPERYLSSFALVTRAGARGVAPTRPSGGAAAVGRLVAHLATLRQMSLSVAGMLQARRESGPRGGAGQGRGHRASSRRSPRSCTRCSDLEPTRRHAAASSQQTLGHLVQRAPSFSLRGGTREVLRGIIARGLGLR